jgi:transposase
MTENYKTHKEVFLRYLELGLTIKEACKRSEISTNTYRRWTRKDKSFKTKVNLTRKPKDAKSPLDIFEMSEDSLLPSADSTLVLSENEYNREFLIKLTISELIKLAEIDEKDNPTEQYFTVLKAFVMLGKNIS